MTLEITLNKVSSYKKPVNLKLEKKVNFFYGLNGSGKTTISNFLQQPTKKCFQNCSIKCDINNETIVYNENFVGDNFYENENQKGIFTLGKFKKGAEKNLKAAEKKKSELGEEKIKINKDISDKTKERENFHIKNVEEIWEIKKIHEHTILDFCLIGYKNDKKIFFNKILETEPEKDSKINIQLLESKVNSLEGEFVVEKELINEIQLAITEIENNPIFQELIVGNENNQLSLLIKDLNNSDWVQKGISYINSEEKCPFCQQKLQKEFLTNLTNYFDEIYKLKMDELSNLKDSYQSEINIIPTLDELKKEEVVANCHGFAEKYNSLLNLLNQNINLIEEKINKPNKNIELNSSNTILNEVNSQIKTINYEIKKYNSDLKNKKEIKEEIKESFWKIVRRDNEGLLKIYLSEIKNFDSKLKEMGGRLDKEIIPQIKKQENIISENQIKANIEASIKNINAYLDYLGFNDFRLQKYQDDYYRIVREGAPENQFFSLSEGEKTIISFLYFLERVRGSISSDGKIEEENRIILIDDPVSSLSHTYMYNIADLIKREIIDKNFSQVIILTHNLYFFHELCIRCERLTKKNICDFYRISKNRETYVVKMNPNDIQNDYWGYWRVIKDFDEDNSKVSNSLLAISMRNIIEHYFGFVNGAKDLSEVMNKITAIDSNYQAFYRYMNRNSHSDSINVSDVKDINPSIFRDAFEKIFEITENKDHFNKMIND